MKINFRIASAVLLTSLFVANTVSAQDSSDNAALIKQGEYLATAADCAACHRSPDVSGKPFSGGYSISSPMGQIISSNITPSREYGIGTWSEAQFAAALREGINNKGQFLYPAMPYTAYKGLTDQDIHALYTYFMQGVAPVDQAPEAQTSLSFPFNIRQVMWGWNLLFTNDKRFVPSEQLSDQLNRGHYLVDALAHCGTCHTPRNALMAEKSSQYLSGSPLGGWYAPNLTSDKTSGLGNWSENDLVNYLKNGHVNDKAQAAGPMAEAVEHSFRKMSDSDLLAIAAWIKQVPAMKTPTATISQPTPLPDINQTVKGQGDQASLANSSTTDGAELYNGACASCHGLAGKGTADHFYPSLSRNSAVTSATPNNLIMAINDGIVRQGQDLKVAMPNFGSQMSAAQIASVAQYVRQHFAGIDTPITAEQVTQLQQGGEKPFIVKYTWALIALGVVVVLLILLAVGRRLRRTRS